MQLERDGVIVGEAPACVDVSAAGEIDWRWQWGGGLF